jgi:hypothetical protein
VSVKIDGRTDRNDKTDKRGRADRKDRNDKTDKRGRTDTARMERQ